MTDFAELEKRLRDAEAHHAHVATKPDRFYIDADSSLRFAAMYGDAANAIADLVRACRYYDEELAVAKEHFLSIRDFLGDGKTDAVDNLADDAARTLAERIAAIGALAGLGISREQGAQDSGATDK